MKTLNLAAAAALGLIATMADADGVVAPADVVFEDGAVEQSLTGAPGNAANGPDIMNKGAGNCIACHEVSALADLPFQGTVGPSLDGAGSRWSEAQLRGIVANAKEMFYESMMPSFYKTSGYIRPGDEFTGKAASEPLPPMLSAEEIEDVVAFLMTMKDE